MGIQDQDTIGEEEKLELKRVRYRIFSLTPAPWGSHYRFVESFDTKEYAELVLEALNDVNVLMNCYKIIEFPVH